MESGPDELSSSSTRIRLKPQRISGVCAPEKKEKIFITMATISIK
jgi:hypothetical protein